MALRSKQTPARRTQIRAGRVARRRQRQTPRPAKRSTLNRRRRDRRNWARAHYERRRRPHSRGGKSPMANGINNRPRNAKGGLLHSGAGPRSALLGRTFAPGYPWKRPDPNNPNGQRKRRRSK